jgi:hypothetical protein
MFKFVQRPPLPTPLLTAIQNTTQINKSNFLHTYISVLNATYYLVPFLCHYMFRPYMAIIRCSFSLCLWPYSLLKLFRFFSFLIYTQAVDLLGLGISPSQDRYLHTEKHKHRINTHRHPCLMWDSNPRSQCQSGRRPFMT